MLPSVASSSPINVSDSVDLPQPLSPTSAITSPRWSCKSTSSTAWTNVSRRENQPGLPAGKYFLRCVTSRISSSDISFSDFRSLQDFGSLFIFLPNDNSQYDRRHSKREEKAFRRYIFQMLVDSAE